MTITYDALNRATTMVDAVGTTAYTYSQVGQLISEDGPWTDDTVSLGYRYDDEGELISARGYESGGMTSRTNEFFGYVYDAAGNLQYRTNSGLVQTFSVNADNELTTVTRSGTLTVSGTTTTNATSVTVNGSTANRYGDATFALGGFTITNGINSYTAFGQDAIGRKDTNTVSVNLPSSVAFEYDLNGNLLGDGLRSYDYDDENQLIRVTTGSTAKSEFVYDGRLRRRITRDFVWGSVGGAVSSMVTNVVLSTTVRSNLTGWAGLRFAVGSSPVVVTALGRWVVSGNSGSHTLKLVRSDGNDVPGATATVNLSGISTNQFSYASLSTPVVLEANTTYFLVSQEVTNGDAWYDYSSTLTPTSGFTINGTVWALNGTTSYTVTAGTNSGYIPVNLKFTTGGWNLAGETRYIYDGMTVVQERDQNNVPLVTYTRGQDLSGSLQGAGGIGGLLARTDQTASTPSHAYYHADGNGNVTAMISYQQNLVAKYLYDPFGNILSKSGWLADANTYRFSSKEWHAGSTLYYFGYRFYSPGLQRWVNRDRIDENELISFVRGDDDLVALFNLYVYCDNTPTMEVDPYGLSGNGTGVGGHTPPPGPNFPNWSAKACVRSVAESVTAGAITGALAGPPGAKVGALVGVGVGLGINVIDTIIDSFNEPTPPPQPWPPRNPRNSRPGPNSTLLCFLWTARGDFAKEKGSEVGAQKRRHKIRKNGTRKARRTSRQLKMRSKAFGL